MSSPLLKPLQVGAVTLANRVSMAPLTRMRAGSPGDVPTELMREYYVQRAGAGLVITEGTDLAAGQGVHGHSRDLLARAGRRLALGRRGLRRLPDAVLSRG